MMDELSLYKKEKEVSGDSSADMNRIGDGYSGGAIAGERRRSPREHFTDNSLLLEETKVH